CSSTCWDGASSASCRGSRAGSEFARRGRSASPAVRGESAEESKQPVHQRKRVGRAAGDVEIHGDLIRHAVAYLGAAAERTAADGTAPHGDHELWLGDGGIRLLQCKPHVLAHGPGDDEAIRVPRGSHELHSEACEVEY